MIKLEELKISTHAKERYAERIMDKENKLEINVYIQQNEEKIKENISKMIEYGELLYSGKPLSDMYDRRHVEIYQKDLWIIIVDPGRNNVITLYSIDLKVGDEMNNMYLEKLLGQLKQAKENFIEVKETIDEEFEKNRKEIALNDELIAQHRKEIKELEKYSESLRGVNEGLQTRATQAEREVREIVGAMIGKKIF